MELGNIVEFLENKCILITGATGFLAKIFLEKVLRVQPKIRKIYLLLRAEDEISAARRFQNEIVGKDLFRVLKERCGANWNSFLLEKTIVVKGDISADDELGIENPTLKERMYNDIDVVINLAATTTFDERYDVAFGINTMGPLHVLRFAARCTNLRVLVHVSTAFVAGERSGLILETPHQLGDALNGVTGLDILEEKKLVLEKLSQLHDARASNDEIKAEMKELGLERARKYGWPNTYVFTKAMGEMLIGRTKGTMSVPIIRPTIVSSTFKEPFPGWVEGMRTVDTFTVAYGTGRVTCFLGDLQGIIDAIPADMVVNAMIVAMVAHAKQPHSTVYHVGSSARNPLKYHNIPDYGYRYFSKKPWIAKDGKPVAVKRVKIIDSMASFHRYMALRYLVGLKALELVNMAMCQLFDETYSNLKRKINFVMRLVDLYRPYLFFYGTFDDTNTEGLRMAARQNGSEAELFYFDPKVIDWDDYVMKAHIPGVVKYVFR